MSDFLGLTTADDVKDGRSFAHYVQQELGTPFPSAVHLATLTRRAKDFFKQYPDADWNTLIRVVSFCKARKKRPANAYGVLAQIRYAYAAGFLPELEPRERPDEHLEAQIEKALTLEWDTKWRERLIGSTGAEVRRKVFVAWREARING